MEFKSFIGIDVSKSTIDIYLKNPGVHHVFSNNLTGFNSMIDLIMEKVGQVIHSELLFGLEHTGIYSESLMTFLNSYNMPFSVIPGLELKRSLGIRRGKSDKADSKAIAEYLYEKREKIKLFNLPTKTMDSIRKLASYRERLVKDKTAFITRLGEYQEIFKEEGLTVFIDSHKEVMNCLDKQIKIIEDEIDQLIKKDTELLRQYKLLNSIKGVGPQTAIMMIVLTKGFSSFKNWRNFASYAGIAPFPNQSGTFIGRTKTSKLSNKRIQALLSMCAGSAIQHNTELKLYYEKRINEGKNKMSTMNIIRNKLVARIFAVIERDTEYVDILKYAS